MILDNSIEQFNRDGFLLQRNFISSATAESLRQSIAVESEAYDAGQRDGDPRYIFARHNLVLEISNLWKIINELTDLELHQRAAAIAARLLGVGRLRLYHDALLKKIKGHPTVGWHQDENYSVVDGRVISAWIPLLNVCRKNGAIYYARGSHRIGLRDAAGKSHEDVYRDLVEEGFEIGCQDMQAGDVLFHDGKVFHFSEPNETDTPRIAVGMFFYADGARLRAPLFGNREYEEVVDRIYFPGRSVGDLADTHLNPVCHVAFEEAGPPVGVR